MDAAQVSSGDAVVEIGPGKGVLTEELLRRGAVVAAIELDDDLALGLSEKFKGAPGFKLVNADFLKLDLAAALGAGEVKFVSNLPYAVAAPILQRILSWPRWTTAVLMFQREVAERIVAEPGGADYGLLTLSVMAHAQAEWVLDVPREGFAPRPKVASAVVRFTRRASAFSDAREEEAFFKIAKAAFGQRRKMAARPIAEALGIEREKVVEALKRCGVAPESRAERIGMDAFLRLPKELGLA